MVVVNRYTGLAIDGFDPVAYFIDAAPKQGRASWNCGPAAPPGDSATKATVRRSRAHPDVYAPRFGGHDPMAVARGAATPGHPRALADRGAAALSVLQRRGAGGLCPRSRRRHRGAPSGTGPNCSARWSALDEHAPGAATSPEAMKAGTQKLPAAILRHSEARCRRACARSPPAASSTAWPAAMSHSDVGASRG